MLMVDTLTNYLQTHSFGTEGVDLFSGAMPEAPDNCVTVYETGGFAPKIATNVEYPTFQVIVRGLDYTTARQKIDDIWKTLHNNTTLFMHIQAMQSPVSIGQDGKKRWEFSVNFKVIKTM